MSVTPLHRPPDIARIDVKGLSKTFQLAGTAIEAVRDISFNVRRGEFVALLGPSGSGKSTILNMIATLIKPSSGQILIDGAPVIPGKATPNVGYVFQRDTLFPWRAVLCENWPAFPTLFGRNAFRPARRKLACRASNRLTRRPYRAECFSALRCWHTRSASRRVW